MQIGTAAPTKDELASAKHHFIHHKSIKEDYNVGAFEKDALSCLENLFNTKNTAIMVGGSGLYTDTVVNGLDSFPKVDSHIRENLNHDLKEQGLAYLQNQLKKLDLKTYETIAIDNPHRIIRALEICLGSGKPYSSFLNKGKIKRNFKTITIGLTADREIIYERINKRVNIMIQDGLLDEVRNLKEYKILNALNTVDNSPGLKEMKTHFGLTI